VTLTVEKLNEVTRMVDPILVAVWVPDLDAFRRKIEKSCPALYESSDATERQQFRGFPVRESKIVPEYDFALEFGQSIHFYMQGGTIMKLKKYGMAHPAPPVGVLQKPID